MADNSMTHYTGTYADAIRTPKKYQVGEKWDRYLEILKEQDAKKQSFQDAISRVKDLGSTAYAMKTLPFYFFPPTAPFAAGIDLVEGLASGDQGQAAMSLLGAPGKVMKGAAAAMTTMMPDEAEGAPIPKGLIAKLLDWKSSGRSKFRPSAEPGSEAHKQAWRQLDTFNSKVKESWDPGDVDAARSMILDGEKASDVTMLLDKIAASDTGKLLGSEIPFQASKSKLVKDHGFKQDNPGGKWLEGKRKSAQKNIDERLKPSWSEADHELKKAIPSWTPNTPKESYSNTLGGGSTTMWGDIDLPTTLLKKMKGAAGEYRGPGEHQFDTLKKTITSEGEKFADNPILVSVGHTGEARIVEGNTRAAVARELGVESIPARVQYLNGAEDIAGPLSPDNLLKALESYLK